MDDLRYEMYHQSYFSDLHSLLPTSADLHLHIKRCMYTTYTQMHCLQNITVDPTNYGYELKDGSLVPIYHQNNVSESLVQKCSGLFCCCFTTQVNNYGHGGTVSSPNHTFSWAGLKKGLTSNSCTYFRL